jgi:hypothetical protein
MDELETGDQISTQFGIAAAPRDVEASAEWERFRAALQERIADLLETDFNRLQAILYVMDVDEAEASRAFALREPQAVSAALADLMIRRHIARMQARRRSAGAPDLE